MVDNNSVERSKIHLLKGRPHFQPILSVNSICSQRDGVWQIPRGFLPKTLTDTVTLDKTTIDRKNSLQPDRYY